MADPTEEPRPEDFEEGGGPVKTFLEHLEDLRWVLIKTGATLLISLIVCLYATTTIVSVLKWPLKQAALIRVGHQQKMLVRFGTNTLTTLDTPTNHLGPLDLGTTWVSVVQIEPVQVGSNIFLSAQVDANPSNEMVKEAATDLVYLDPSH